MRFFRETLVAAAAIAAIGLAVPAWGEPPLVRIPSDSVPDSFAASEPSPLPTISSGTRSTAPFRAPTITLQPPTFDPYSTVPGAGAASMAPSLLTPPPPPPFAAPGSGLILPPTGGSPVIGGAGLDPYATLPGQAIPPSSPSALFPGYSGGGLFGNGFGQGMGGLFGGGLANPGESSLRLVYPPRVRAAYIYGGTSPREMMLDDFDVALPFAVPNFLWTGQPIYILPSFSLHLWDGPQGIPNADLPSKAYSAYIDSAWSSNADLPFGAEVGVRVGVFTDFQALTTQSFRILGQGLGRVRLTPNLTVKAGVVYIDRLNYKLFPAGGIFWDPNPQTKIEAFFPKPKVSHYLTTMGNQDVWWFLGAEYGAGSWTIERIARPELGIPGPFADQVDINDIRLFGGFEWGPEHLVRTGHRIGFIEAGWVTEREVLYRNRPQDSFNLRDSFMVRAGFFR